MMNTLDSLARSRRKSSLIRKNLVKSGYACLLFLGREIFSQFELVTTYNFYSSLKLGLNNEYE